MAIALIAGCGGGVPTNLHDTYRLATQAYCEARFRCCSPTQAMANLGATNVWQCATSMSSRLDRAAEVIQITIDKGYGTFDPAAAGLCIDAIRSGLSSCMNSTFQLNILDNPLCTSMVVGNVKPGAHCNSNYYNGGCQPGSFCTGAQTCHLYAKAGESCSSTLCDPNLVCLSTGKCGIPLDDGQVCTTAGPCKSAQCPSGICLPTPTVAPAICSWSF